MKKTITWIMAILMGLTAFSLGACDNSADLSSSKPDSSQTTVEVPEKQPESNITATIVRPDQTYDFCSEIAFLGSDLAATSESGYAAVSAELVATVEPIDANQNVDWSVAFVNPSSTWASGKTVSDYVTVTTETAGSTTATVTCKAPFGEQIVITCTSQEIADISADCTVDFVQTVQSVSLTFGDDLPINLGGETGIEWEMNPNGVGKGGAANVNVETYDTYTIATDAYSWEIDLISPDYYYNGVDDETWGTDSRMVESEDGLTIKQGDLGDLALRDNYGKYKTISSDDEELEYNIAFFRHEKISNLIFDYAFADDNFLIGTSGEDSTGQRWVTYRLTYTISGISGFFASEFTDGVWIIDWSRLVDEDTITEASMYTLRLTLKNSTETVEFLSLLKWEAFTNNPLVQSVSLANSALKF